jgi:formylglycine-generating enzyme required for sulfatase activity
MKKVTPVFSVIEIPTGTYEIGSGDIPNASPRHQRSLREKVWLMDAPLMWRHFQTFVIGGGFKNRSIMNRSGALNEQVLSVDQLVSQLLAQSLDLQKVYPWTEFEDNDQPLTGMTWHEAGLVAGYFEARLPSEIEWEIGTRLLLGSGRPKSFLGKPDPNQQWLEEWTADAYSPRYWRADFERTSLPWSKNHQGGVSIRGGLQDSVHKHLCSRTEAQPSNSSPRRGFRLAWDAAPINASVLNK